MITICKACGKEEFYFKIVTYADGKQHIQQRCWDCNTFQTNVKQSNESKSNEKYRNEYMENQEATPSQISFIQNVIKYKGDIRNRLQASELISNYKNKK